MQMTVLVGQEEEVVISRRAAELLDRQVSTELWVGSVRVRVRFAS
jgi:hypothetical protein